MSESQASLLLRRLGLWARRDIVLSQDGRILGGSLDPQVEALYQQLFELHDRILERRPISCTEKDFLAHCQSIIECNRAQIRELEREFA